MSKISLSLAALAAALVAGSAARAEDQPAQPAPTWVAPCKADAEKLCKGQTDQRACLTGHDEELSPDCQKPIRQYNIVDSCHDDFDKLCKEARAQGGLSKCITDNKDKLSDKCKTALDKGAKKVVKEEVTVTKPAPKKKGKK